ncbi:MAG: MFS transporter, partial [Sandaracinaceae bacterium]|nr:MFS transporter [Sandaracinaceae bacterium]
MMRGLRHEGSFLLYQVARFLGAVSIQILSVATGWEVYGRTHRPAALGFVGLFTFLPQVLFFPLTGTTADRYDRRWVVAFSFLGIAIGAWGLAWAAAQVRLSIFVFYGLIFILGVARAFAGPASQAMVPLL